MIAVHEDALLRRMAMQIDVQEQIALFALRIAIATHRAFGQEVRADVDIRAQWQCIGSRPERRELWHSANFGYFFSQCHTIMLGEFHVLAKWLSHNAATCHAVLPEAESGTIPTATCVVAVRCGKLLLVFIHQFQRNFRWSWLLHNILGILIGSVRLTGARLGVAAYFRDVILVRTLCGQ